MDLFDVVRALVRRWYVAIPIILATAAMVYTQYTSVKIVYYSSTAVGIAPSNEVIVFPGEGGRTPRNGLLDVGGPALITSMTALALNEAAMREKIVAQGGRRNYTVRNFPSPAAAAALPPLPILLIEATEPDSQSATKTVELVANEADAAMRNFQRQAGVGDAEMVKALRIGQPATVAARPSRTRSAFLFSVTGIGIAIFVAVLFELVATRRKGQRQNPAERRYRDDPPPPADVDLDRQPAGNGRHSS